MCLEFQLLKPVSGSMYRWGVPIRKPNMDNPPVVGTARGALCSVSRHSVKRSWSWNISRLTSCNGFHFLKNLLLFLQICFIHNVALHHCVDRPVLGRLTFWFQLHLKQRTEFWVSSSCHRKPEQTPPLKLASGFSKRRQNWLPIQVFSSKSYPDRKKKMATESFDWKHQTEQFFFLETDEML